MTCVARTVGVRSQARSGQESEALLRLFLERVPAAVAMFDTDMRYLACSQRYRTDFGLGEQEIAGRSHYELFPEIPPRWKEIHRRCLAGAVERCEEDPFPRADGRLDWVRWEMQPWHTEAGQVGGLLLFSELITERKAAELDTRAIAARARCIIWHARVEELPGGVLHWEPMVLDETAAQRFFPLPVGPDGSYWLAWAASRVPEDHQRMNAHGHAHVRAGKSYSQEFRCRDAAGAVRWFAEDVQVDPIGPGQWRAVGVCVDVTRRRQMEQALERERNVTSTLQRAFLPDRLPDCQGYRFGTCYHPALDEAMVGGDFYDVFPLPGGRIGLLLGDVSGKGVSAAACGAMTRHMLRAYAVETSSPAEVLGRVNRALCQVVDDPNLFVTAFYAVLDPEADRLRYANAGHWPALLAQERRVEVVGGNGLALSIVPEASYAEGQLHLEPGDELLVFTDGLVEIERADPMAQFEALRDAMQSRRDEPPQQLVDRLYRDALARGAGLLRDDVALLVLRCEKPPRGDRAAASSANNRSAALRE